MKRSIIGDNALLAIAIVVGCVLIVTYSMFAFYKYALGPSIVVDTPKYGEVLASSSVTISGSTKRLSRFFINGLETPLSTDGTFEVVRTPAIGYTVVTVTGEDRFRRTLTISVPILVQPVSDLHILTTNLSATTSATTTNETKGKKSSK